MLIKNRLFWKFGWIHSMLFLLVLVAIYTYVVRSIRLEYIQDAFRELEAFSQLAKGRPPANREEITLKEWSNWMARAGIRITIIDPDGIVLADSEEDPVTMDNHRSRPEIREALESGMGKAVRHSPTLGRDLVYLAALQPTMDGADMVIRFSIPLENLDRALADFQRSLWIASVIIVILAAGVSLLFFRRISSRIERLKDFSGRIASGNFRRLPLDRKNDELTDLSNTLNQTAQKLDTTIQILTEGRNQSAAVLSSTEEGIVVISPDQKVIFCNPAFCRALRIEEKDWKDRPVVEVVPNVDLINLIQKACSANKTVTSEIVVGSVHTKSFAVTVTPVLSDDTPEGSVMVLHDISDLRRLERIRRDFIANISHEFKTPLTAIQGFTETLLNGALDDRDVSRRFLDIIMNHSIRLRQLTDDLLKLSQIEAGELQLKYQPFVISDLIDPCIELARPSIDQKHIALETNYDQDIPVIQGDVFRLQQALQNLIDNAVFFTPPGGRISVKAHVQSSEIAISVTDTGTGIPQAEQERIFERFYRADSARSREEGGTGLGLSIAKHLIEAHGGRIRVHSEVGVGSTFSLYIPTNQ